jgi:hypothetical protein
MAAAVCIANPFALQAAAQTAVTLAGDKENHNSRDVIVESNAGVAVSPPLFC